MALSTSAIDNTVTDPGINAILAEIGAGEAISRGTCRFSQNEDRFTILETPVEIPPFTVHHDFQDPIPPEGYVEALADVVRQVAEGAPWLLDGTRWFFDPVNIHAPAFYRVEEFADRSYLYLARIDLGCRALESDILETGTNSRTHRFRTDRLYHESDWFPLAPGTLPADDGRIAFDQTIPITWKGEAGEGYMIHGIWMDSDINKFLSKLVLPPGRRNHPFYPVTCKHRCVSVNALGMEPSSGRSGPAALHAIRERFEPELDAILDDLQNAPFSELLPLFKDIKARVSPDLGTPWENLKVTAYLNDREQKEYSVEL